MKILSDDVGLAEAAEKIRELAADASLMVDIGQTRIFGRPTIINYREQSEELTVRFLSADVEMSIRERRARRDQYTPFTGGHPREQRAGLGSVGSVVFMTASGTIEVSREDALFEIVREDWAATRGAA